MGKSSPPPAPTPPTAAEISAANVESAKGLTRLQRAMQFGEELFKEGIVREGVPIPEGSTEVFEDVTRTESAPTQMADNGQYRVTIGADGLISETYHPSWDEAFVGKPWQEIKEEFPHFSEEGEQEISITESVSQGFETPSGEIIQPEKYYQIGEDGGRTEVTRNQAIEADFTGRGDTDLARQQWEFTKETSPQQTQFLLDQMKQFGPEFTEQARALVERSDPTGFAARELLGNLAQEYQPAEVPVGPEMQEMGEFAAAERIGAPPSLAEVAYTPTYERAGEMNQLERSVDAPSLERLENIPEIVADAESMAGRRFAERDLIERAQSGRAGDLMAEEASRLARGRQAATGNIFGGGAVLQESRAVRQAEEAGQRQGISDLLGFLSSGQTAGDAEARIAQQNLMNKLMGIEQRTGAEQAEFGMGQQVLSQRNQAEMAERADQLGAMAQRNQAEESEFQSLLQGLGQQQGARTAGFGMQQQAIGQRNQAADTDFARQQAAMGQRNQARQQAFNNAMQRTATQQQMQQQQMANLQSFSGLAPVSSQFGGLAGAQQAGAANFNPIQYTPTSGMQLLQGQQNLAGNVFGTQSNIYDTQMSNQSGGFGGLLGSLAGSAVGSTGFGAALGKKLFE